MLLLLFIFWFGFVSFVFIVCLHLGFFYLVTLLIFVFFVFFVCFLAFVCLVLILLFVLGFACFHLFLFLLFCYLSLSLLFFFPMPQGLLGLGSLASSWTWSSGRKHWAQDIGAPENSWSQRMLICVSSLGGIHLDTKTWLLPTVCKLQCWEIHAKQVASPEHCPIQLQTGCQKLY